MQHEPTQIERILAALRGGERDWWSLPELAAETRVPVNSLSAQLRNLKKPEYGKHDIRRRVRHGNLHEYRLVQPATDREGDKVSV
jgi:hypothetical protein